MIKNADVENDRDIFESNIIWKEQKMGSSPLGPEARRSFSAGPTSALSDGTK